MEVEGKMYDIRHEDKSGGWPKILAKERERKRNNLDSMTGVTFCGCGFLGVYLVGAATYIQEHRPKLLSRKLGGSSVGSIVAASIACGVNLQHVRRILLEEAKVVRKTFMGALNPFYRLEEPLMESLLKILPEDAHRRASGRVFLSLTKASTLTNEVISQYSTRDELIRAILCCCFLPCLSGYTAPIFNGRRYIDGGMSNNMPLKGPTIVSINAFSGEFEICPRDETGDLRPLNRSLNQCLAMSNENLYRLKCGLLPPEPEELDQHYHYGYFHARDFFCPSGASKVRRPVKLRMEGGGEGEGEDQERKR